MLFMFAVHHSI